LNAIREQARALNCLGEVDYHRGNSESAITVYRQANALWSSINDAQGRAETLLLLGSAYSDINDLDVASQCLTEARTLSSELGLKRGRALTDLALVSLARQGARLRNVTDAYQDAANQLTRLQDRFRTASDAVWEGAALSTLAYLSDEMGDGSRALRNWEGASKLVQAAGLQIAALETSIRIGTGYLAANAREALNWFEEARALSEAAGNDHFRSWALRFIGAAQLVEGDSQAALHNLEKSLDGHANRRPYRSQTSRHRVLARGGRAKRCPPRSVDRSNRRKAPLDRGRRDVAVRFICGSTAAGAPRGKRSHAGRA
jgi:tetratricopeptide (TPR) repeat protein